MRAAHAVLLWLLTAAVLLGRAPVPAGSNGGVADREAEQQRLHVGIDLGSEFAKVAIELAAGRCDLAARRPSGPAGNACRGLVRRSDPIVLTPDGKVRLTSVVSCNSRLSAPGYC